RLPVGGALPMPTSAARRATLPGMVGRGLTALAIVPAAVALANCLQGEGRVTTWLLVLAALPALRLVIDAGHRRRVRAAVVGSWRAAQLYARKGGALPWRAALLFAVL